MFILYGKNALPLRLLYQWLKDFKILPLIKKGCKPTFDIAAAKLFNPKSKESTLSFGSSKSVTFFTLPADL